MLYFCCRKNCTSSLITHTREKEKDVKNSYTIKSRFDLCTYKQKEKQDLSKLGTSLYVVNH